MAVGLAPASHRGRSLAGYWIAALPAFAAVGATSLYMMAARNLLQDRVHYRDLFDTNMPGFVWVTTAIYSVFGP